MLRLFLRGVQIIEATLASSSSAPLKAASSLGSTFEAVLAALRASASTSTTADTSRLKVLIPSSTSASVPFGSATADCVASPLSPSAPSRSLIVALHANKWIRASLGTSPAIARDENCYCTALTPVSPIFVPIPYDALMVSSTLISEYNKLQ